MREREPETRHLKTDEIREQLELLAEERKTTLYRRRSAKEVAETISGPSERTVTMLDAGIQKLAQGPRLGAGTARAACEEHAPAKEQSPAATRGARSKTHRVFRLGSKAPLIGGAIAVLSAAILAAAVAWSSSPRVSAERVGAAEAGPSHREAPLDVAPQTARAPQAAARVEPPDPPAASSPNAPAAPSEAPGAQGLEPPAKAPSAPSRPATSARPAVDLLLAGKTRDALDAYRALVAEPGSTAELEVVVRLLEHELRSCREGQEGHGPCAP